MSDTQEQSPTPSARPDGASGGESSNAAAPKRPAVRFVLVFIVLTFALLTAGRFAIGTSAMNWYLFQVARHTSWVLGLIGDECTLEHASVYQGREEHVRASLAAWRRGESAPLMRRSTPQAGPPLLPWESWCYRAERISRTIAIERACMDELKPVDRPSDASLQATLDYVDVIVTQTEASASREDAEGRASTVAEPGLAEFILEARKAIQILGERAHDGDPNLAEGLADFATQTESWRDRQAAYLENRLAKLVNDLDHFGPQVSFTAREGIAPGAPSPDGEPGDPGTPAVRFRFTVVADCGAIPSMSIFLAAVVAFPVLWWKRLAGIAVGVPALYVVNVLRLACLAVIGAWTDGGPWFKFAHEYVWQGIYIIFVVGIWLIWVELLVRRGGKWHDQGA
ncbi:MAG: exosortase/archaeosortase family protein [bacterium]|nr:exosortase/archaeosortase family protein [bacterium]